MYYTIGRAPGHWRLTPCSTTHPRHWTTCDPRVVVCHHGPAFDDDGIEMGDNRVLAYFGLLAGSRLLNRVDLIDVDDTYRLGELVVTLHLNDSSFLDPKGVVTTAYAVTWVRSSDLQCTVAVVEDRETAIELFATACLP